ncbi:flavin reductase family protein [Rhizobium sp. KVB221]|uniref:Flavin reductase family protein n=1 Tax=Rhizobium setariae TaxID=2801340 RepID=A0A936YWL5_9HYPH|nr:flavin reductase family protein [Rhizobium setariae]MBL0375222.1 flavin reductase family protein [Rhizobium setariae]
MVTQEQPQPGAVLQADFKKGMRRLSSSVSIITAGGAAGRNGMTATAVCSVSAEPPILLVGINLGASIHDQIESTGAFGVNILRPKHRHLADRFSSGLSGEARFEIGQWSEGALGVPVMEDALASFACQVIKVVTIGTHDIFFGQVVGIDVSEGTPLLYGGGQYEISLAATPLAYHATL